MSASGQLFQMSALQTGQVSVPMPDGTLATVDQFGLCWVPYAETVQTNFTVSASFNSTSNFTMSVRSPGDLSARRTFLVPKDTRLFIVPDDIRLFEVY